MTDIVPSTTEQYTTRFDELKRVDEYGEWWSARDLMTVFGYSTWQKFSGVVDRAKLACVTSGQDLTSNFNHAVKIDSSRHKRADVRLTRYAAYLVAMEAEPGEERPAVGAAKTYFAVQTRKAEVGIDAFEGPYRAMYEQLVHLQRLEREQRRQAGVQELLREEIRDVRADFDAREERMQSIAAQAQEAVQSIKELSERVADTEAVTPLADTRHLRSGKEAAQLLGYGHIRFFEILRELGVLYRDPQQGGHKIYQRYMDQGWGQAKYVEWPNGNGWAWAPFFTAKGISRIQNLIKESQLPVG